jgi:uncharacterized protein YecE (DUF72 family)
MARIRIGLSSWTDRSLIESGKFYPPVVISAEARLRHYAAEFPDLVEVNSTHYALPAESNALRWAERTPAGFVFDVRMHGLITHHPTPLRSLPEELVAELPEDVRSADRIHFNQVPRHIAEEVMARFVAALKPLHEVGKLGAVLLQFPRWFEPCKSCLAHIAWCEERLGQYLHAVEFRNALWLDDRRRETTFSFLREYGLAYVCVDEPPGHPWSVPPVVEVTHPGLAYVRFHGRRHDTWEKPGVTPHERTRYLYSEDELREWVPRLRRLADEANEVHVLVNTNYEDYAVRNARQLRMMLR